MTYLDDESCSNRLELTCIDTHTGVTAPQRVGFMGYAAIPGAEHMFDLSLSRSIAYARATGCKTINILAGCPGSSPIIQQAIHAYIINQDVGYVSQHIKTYLQSTHPSHAAVFSASQTLPAARDSQTSQNPLPPASLAFDHAYTSSSAVEAAWSRLIPSHMLNQHPATCGSLSGLSAILKQMILSTLVRNLREASRRILSELDDSVFMVLEPNSDVIDVFSPFSSSTYVGSGSSEYKDADFPNLSRLPCPPSSVAEVAGLLSYALPSFFHVIEALVSADVSNCGVIFDTFHVYRIHGPLHELFSSLFSLIRHVTLSNVSYSQVLLPSRELSGALSPGQTTEVKSSLNSPPGSSTIVSPTTGDASKSFGSPSTSSFQLAPVQFAYRSSLESGVINMASFLTLMQSMGYVGWSSLTFTPETPLDGGVGTLGSSSFSLSRHQHNIAVTGRVSQFHSDLALSLSVNPGSAAAHTMANYLNHVSTWLRDASRLPPRPDKSKNKDKEKEKDPTAAALQTWYLTTRLRRFLSAGTLFACNGKQGKSYVLLGLDAKRHAWGPFFGRPDREDPSPEATAVRETTEESLGVLLSGNTLLAALTHSAFRLVFPASQLFMVNLGVMTASERDAVTQRFAAERDRRKKLEKSEQEVEEIQWFDASEFYKGLVLGKKATVPKLRKFFRSIFVKGMVEDPVIRDFVNKQPLRLLPVTELIKVMQQQQQQQQQAQIQSSGQSPTQGQGQGQGQTQAPQSLGIRSVSSPM